MYYAIVAVIAAAVAFQTARDGHDLAFQDLTLPAQNLPAGCALAPPPSMGSNGVIVVQGVWMSRQIQTNPWTGTDAAIIVAIREQLEPIVIPDGPPLSARAHARFRMKLAEGVEAAYVAVYSQSRSRNAVTVYSLRFATASDAADFWRSVARSDDAGLTGVVADASVAVVSGDGADCFQAVAAHVKSVLK